MAATRMVHLDKLIRPFGFQLLIPASRSFASTGLSKKDKERRKILEEMNRGYFEDIKDLKKHEGKVIPTSTDLDPAATATIFPKSEVYSVSREYSLFPPKDDDTPARLICLSFRASAERMVDSWVLPLRNAFPSDINVRIYELSWVESGILSFFPVRKLFLMCISASEACKKLDRKVFYAFGDSYDIRKELHVTNRLTGYLFLLDGKGRIRWRASGKATDEEAAQLVSCVSRLLDGES